LVEVKKTEPTPQTNFRRIEEKFKLTPEEAQGLYQELSNQMTADEFFPGQKISSITTLYCDGVGLPLFTAAKSGGIRNRVRLRLYGEWSDAQEPYVWLEWKLSPPRNTEDTFTTKRRFRIPKMRLATFFTDPLSNEELRSFQKSKNADDAQDCYQKLRQLTDGLGLRPLVASHYQRRALLLGSNGDRLTFDFALGYSLIHLEADTLCLSDTVEEGAVIVECKRSAPLAAWVRERLQEFPRVIGFSKFERALELTSTL
jgi:hypothetical protein